MTTPKHEKRQTYSTLASKPKRVVKAERNENHMYYDTFGNSLNSSAVDIGEFVSITNNTITFLSYNGVKFTMNLNNFAQTQNVSDEIISILKEKK